MTRGKEDGLNYSGCVCAIGRPEVCLKLYANVTGIGELLPFVLGTLDMLEAI